MANRRAIVKRRKAVRNINLLAWRGELLALAEGGLPCFEGHRIRIATGASMAPLFAERTEVLAAATGAEVEVLAVDNGALAPGPDGATRRGVQRAAS